MTPRRSGGEKAFTCAGFPSEVLPSSSSESDTACKGGQSQYGLSLMAFRCTSRGSILSSSDSTSEPLRASSSESDTSLREGQSSDRYSVASSQIAAKCSELDLSLALLPSSESRLYISPSELYCDP